MTDMTNGRRNDDGSVTPWATKGEVTPVEFNPFYLVSEFQRIFDTSQDPELWADLVREETAELLEAMGDTGQDTARGYWGNVLKESADLIYVVSGYINLLETLGDDNDYLSPAEVTVAEVAIDEVVGLIGPDFMEEAFKLVHASNLSKLLPDGSVLRREDGKVLKGPNYLPPDMGPLADRLYAELNGAN